MRTLQGEVSARDLRLALVASRFNFSVTERLVRGAFAAIEEHQGDVARTPVVWVPGALEIPIAAKKLAESQNYDAIICLGVVIRGETYHFEVVANETSSGLMQAMLTTNIPMAMGVITVDTLEQALARSGEMKRSSHHDEKRSDGNKGYEAALVAMEMAHLLRQIS